MVAFYPAQLALPPVASGTPTLDVIHNLDSLLWLKGLPSAFADMVVTSPPYNLRNTSGSGRNGRGGKWHQALLESGYDDHEDNMPHDQYVAWQRDILTESMRVTRSDGAIFYNHKWRVQDGLLQDRAEIVRGFPVRQVIIWQRAGGVNFNDGYFLPTYEVIYLIAKPDFKLMPKANHFGDVWSITQDTDNPHPAPFPVEIPRRCILAGSPRGGIVLDPFMGSGSTAVAAKQTGRHYIGCDLSYRYVVEARERVAKPFMLSMFDRIEVAPQLTQRSLFSVR